ncbi:hypothetical protein OPIT5_01410 [Opitutaceae bacterium TAV5]|nr:hypothetical protein OPIT5_01410 [Opitutaceae bacterium TAV5]
MTSKTLLALAALLLPFAVSASEILIKENFESIPTGRIAPGRYTHIVPWQGPSRQFGWIGVTDQYPESAASGKDHLNAVAFYDSASDKNKAPSLQFRWEDKAPQSGILTLAWDFLVPVEKPFLAIHFLGSNWKNSTAALLLADGAIILHADKGDASRIRIGTYTVGVWHSIKVTLDPGARTLDVWIDGKKAVNAISWLETSPKTIDRFSTVADYAPVDRMGAAVLYLDNIEVSATSAP